MSTVAQIKEVLQRVLGPRVGLMRSHSKNKGKETHPLFSGRIGF
jgi:hypothetical protein